MADKKISQLTAATTPLAGTEVLPIVQGGSTVKVSAADITAGRAVATGNLTVTGNATVRNTSADSQLFIQSNTGYQNSIGFGEVGVRNNGALGFESGSDTLLYRGGTASVTSGGTLVFSATSNGRFGIGTSSPGSALDVRGNVEVKNSGANSALYITAPNDTYSPLVYFGVSGVRNSGIIGFPAGDDAFVYRSSASSFSDGTERFRISVTGDTTISTGNLVVGTAGKGIEFSGGLIWRTGTGTPEGAVTAPVGSLFTRTDGGANTTLYVKESGAGNTGWVAK